MRKQTSNLTHAKNHEQRPIIKNMNRAPETLGELKKEILRQLDTSEVVTITLHEGDEIHELLESISSGLAGIKYQSLHDRPLLFKP